ncbi:MAG TPA: hypothetical protein VF665_20570 [Longimicrobium sp.]|jgi:hypothetical protein|uniref:hypothetical protein n=1 Tax=Longimicrobium sp. TaxID=2029185 RepID=UPI002ED7E850
MAGQRTYDDDEVRAIFAEAARRELAEPRPAPAANGLTLVELQDIGREAGLDVAAVTRAAASLDAPAVQTPVRRSLGMPVEVVHTVALPRAPTEGEWEKLVAELRSTFRARGRVASQGGLREWSNGNLHALVEPSVDGYRLRLGTVKGNARVLNALGGASLFAGAAALSSALSGGLPQDIIVPGMIAATGLGAFAANLLRLPRWAQTRRRQMDLIGAKAAAIMAADPHPAG